MYSAVVIYLQIQFLKLLREDAEFLGNTGGLCLAGRNHGLLLERIIWNQEAESFDYLAMKHIL